MNSNAIKADRGLISGSPRPRVQPEFSLPAENVTGLRWMVACAAVGTLYFLGICAGYLIFATVLPELRLAYLFAGVFLVIVFLRLIAFRFGVVPNKYCIGMYGVYALIVAIQALWFLPVFSAGGSDAYVTLIGDTAVVSGILAITGETFGTLWAYGRNRALLAWTGIPFALCFSTIILGVLLGWSSTAEIRLMFQNVTEEGVFTFNYLSLGDAVAILGLLILGQVKQLPFRLGLMIFTAGTLFFAYSRTSFFLYMVCAVIVLVVGAKTSQRIGLVVAGLILASAVGAVFSDSEVLRPAIDRMSVLIADPTQDDSYRVRVELMQENMAHLKENWILGRFMDQWWRSGENAGYIHNWLSFWQSYGIVPFLGSITLFGFLARNLWLELLHPKPSTSGGIAIFAFGMIAIITSRSYAWPFIWLTLGVVSGLTNASRSPANVAKR